MSEELHDRVWSEIGRLDDRIEDLEQQLRDVNWENTQLRNILKDNNIHIPDLKSELKKKRKAILESEIKQLKEYIDEHQIVKDTEYKDKHDSWNKRNFYMTRSLKKLEDRLKDL
jgi:hypothetical protein